MHVQVGRWFAFKDRDAKFTVECRAGFITFLMVSYVLAVNPNILITTGGTCNPQEVCTVRSFDATPAALVQFATPAVADCLQYLELPAVGCWLPQSMGEYPFPSRSPFYLPVALQNYDLLGPSCLGNANDAGAQNCLVSKLAWVEAEVGCLLECSHEGGSMLQQACKPATAGTSFLA